MMFIERIGSGIIFIAISPPFYWYVFIYDSRLSIDDEGVHLHFLWIKRRSIPWASVAQAGIGGKKIFNQGNKLKTGAIYIWFSEEELDDDACFRMMLKWPQAGTTFLKFDHDRLRRIQAYYSQQVKRYNTGKLFFN